MNTENSKTSEPHRFKLDLTDKLNLKTPPKKYGFSQVFIYLFIYLYLFIYYTLKNIKSEYNNNLRFQHQLGMILLIYLMVFILLLIFRIILNF